MATYTSEYSQFPYKIYELNNFRAITDQDSFLVNRIKSYIEERDYAQAQYYIEQNKDILKSIAIDANYINALEEELRNLEIYCSNSMQHIFTDENTPGKAQVNDIWVHGGKEREQEPRTYLYGVKWLGTNDTSLERTDSSQYFEDPSPAIGLGLGSSPFDRLMPWKGMRVINDNNAGELVEIPKYWYKWTSDGLSLQLQISSKKLSGFYTSPAHADRGDGKGERDYVYVGRYHSNNRNYRSVSGLTPVTAVPIDMIREQLTDTASGYYMSDFAMFWTIRMLYLVEYANWNVRTTIGIGDGNGTSPYITGSTGIMNYHTGTMASYRDRPGSTQYRYIEDLWGNVRDYVDGISFENEKIYVIKNPVDYITGNNKIQIGTRPTSNGYISSWSIPTESGLEYALYPAGVGGTSSSFVSDECRYTSVSGSASEILCTGGYFDGYDDYAKTGSGLFTMIGMMANDAINGAGARIMKI